jgi:hypothetical protein
MKGKFYIEGHKSKAGWEDESTLILQDANGYATLDQATTRPRNISKRIKTHLVVIYQEDKDRNKVGAKMIFRGDEGALEESLLFY